MSEKSNSGQGPDRVDVVVIGGGIVGCSVLYHLAKAGCRNVLLLERHQITSGTTWHSAALVTPLRAWGPGTDLGKYSVQLYSSLEQETGQATGWRQPGHLNLAASKDRLISLEHTASIARAQGLEAHIIGPAEIREKWPLLRTDDLFGAIWSPYSGRVNPSDVCSALLKGARTAGAHYLENTPVLGFEISNRRIKGVRTPARTIGCDAVVMCTGLWGRSVAAEAGITVPLYACEHLYLLTESINGITRDLPVVRDGDAFLYLREETGGLLVGCFEPNPKALPLSKLPKNDAFVLLEEDWDHVAPMLGNAIHRVPVLSNVGIRSYINGPESFTMDHLPILGESAEVGGFFVACGMNSGGVALAGGVGWAMADWVLKGRPPVDLSSADVRRYMPYQNNERALLKRIPEVLAHHFEIPWPNHDYATVRQVRRTPFYAALKARGAAFTQRGGWERPGWFNPPGSAPDLNTTYGRPGWFQLWAEEHLAARNAVALFDMSPFSKLYVQGRDSTSLLQRVCANDVDVNPGRLIYTALLNEDAGMESDLTVTRLTETTYLVVTGSLQGRRDADWLQRHILPEEHVTITDVTSAYAVLSITGPRSRELLSRVSPADLSNNHFPFGTARQIEVGYGIATALRVSYAGELGWELYIPSDLAESVFEEVLSASDGLHARLAGVHALASLRMEKGFRSWGHDVGPADTPIESGLMFAVRLKKPEFIGKEVLLRRREAGARRRLLSMVIESPDAFPYGHEPIYRDGVLCGSLTSATYGHTIGSAVGLGWINSQPFDDEMLSQHVFEVEIANKRYKAMPSVKAPFDPLGERMRM